MSAEKVVETIQETPKELLGDALLWFPREMQHELQLLKNVSDVSSLSNPVETSFFLAIILAIKEVDLDKALILINEAYEGTTFPSELFLLRARVHFLKKEFDEMELCFRAVTDLVGSSDVLIQTIQELMSLMEECHKDY
jgi:hypothetical protein